MTRAGDHQWTTTDTGPVVATGRCRWTHCCCLFGRSKIRIRQFHSFSSISFSSSSSSSSLRTMLSLSTIVRVAARNVVSRATVRPSSGLGLPSSRAFGLQHSIPRRVVHSGVVLKSYVSGSEGPPDSFDFRVFNYTAEGKVRAYRTRTDRLPRCHDSSRLLATPRDSSRLLTMTTADACECVA